MVGVIERAEEGRGKRDGRLGNGGVWGSIANDERILRVGIPTIVAGDIRIVGRCSNCCCSRVARRLTSCRLRTNTLPRS